MVVLMEHNSPPPKKKWHNIESVRITPPYPPTIFPLWRLWGPHSKWCLACSAQHNSSILILYWRWDYSIINSTEGSKRILISNGDI